MTINVFQVANDSEGFKRLFENLQKNLINQPPVQVGEWQSQRMDMPMRELRNVSFGYRLPDTQEELHLQTGAHLPWAEDHFLERVGGQPLNPAPSEAWWPFRKKSEDGDTNKDHKSEGAAFSHTYPERMWPKFANVPAEVITETPYATQIGPEYTNRGIRFDYGDLQDVVMQLYKSPMTRQAYLPIWFPEDTGAVHGKRVPCTLGYHFAIRDRKLDITYYMRSTDLLRHFQDDIYLAGRLAQWVVEQFNDYHYSEGHPEEIAAIQVGELIFHTANLHIFDGDVDIIKWRRSQGQMAWPE